MNVKFQLYRMNKSRDLLYNTVFVVNATELCTEKFVEGKSPVNYATQNKNK